MVEKIKLALERAYRERESALSGADTGAEARSSQNQPLEQPVAARPVAEQRIVENPVVESPVVEPTPSVVDPTEAVDTTALLDNAAVYNIETSRFAAQRIVTYHDNHPAVESYRLLRTQLLQQRGPERIASFGITSPNPDEGKSLTCANLAISMARSAESRVILMDADISNPSTHALFGINVESGLIDFLGGTSPLNKVLLKTNISNLWLVPGRVARESIVERAGMAKFDHLISSLTGDQRNTLIVDLPPVLAKDDTLAVASHLDGIVLIVEEGSTRTAEVNRSMDLLRNCNILGSVINKFSRKQASYY